ncbi:hypothetical protein DH2020_045312 [Rehmannia glutinosa]|uniref:Kinesin-like protein n=1 Tax=Rehmannia glutinosa TaxID=99300 RepID=A0ABR0UEE8_REHGL
MGAIGTEDLMSEEKLQGMGNLTEEKILVLVRLRPLSEKEIARNEVADWECINSTTILYRTVSRSDRVFRGDNKTREVYDEGIKDIALSVLGGINYSTPLRLLDDPETIESSAREFIGKGNSTALAASVNFVDLAGSERASQALSVGQRLKEGCYINRSLLTLSTVIRKLSKGRQGHINYRDSKLTRILQPALGGNARTAIICTLSPARSHVEQSRNTLLFASCAKEVSTNAQVNVVMSDKALVKHLQKEVARLESELKTPGSICDHGPLLRKKDTQIEKLEKEIRELKKQRDLAHSRIDDLLRAIENDKHSQKLNEIQSFNGEFRCNGTSDLLHSENSEDTCSSDDVSDPSQEIEDPSLGIGEDSDETCKEVRCVEMGESGHNRTNESLRQSTSESEESMPILSESANSRIMSSPRQVIGSDNVYSNGVLEQKIQGVQKTIDSLFRPYHDVLSPGGPSTSMTFSGNLKLTRSRSCRAGLMTVSPDFEMADQSESTPPTVLEENFTRRSEGVFPRKQWKIPPVMFGANSAKLSRKDSQSSDYSSFVNEMKNQNSSHGDEDIPTLGSFVAGLREMAKLQYENQTGHQTERTEEKNSTDVALDPMNNWPLKFEKLQKMIIELWQACNVSLVHRTYFILLIKDDLTDSIYMEVEHRRLSFLKETFSRGNSAVQDGRTLTMASSKKALRREREMLSRLMYKRYTEDERNRLYNEWGISLNSKQRRLQLVHLLWGDTENMDLISKSAAIVAKLIGFSEQGQKEMLGLSFMPPRMIRRSFGWKNSMTSLL